MAQAEPSQSTGRDTGTNPAEGFGRFKNDLADHLDLHVIKKISNLLGLKPGKIERITRSETPGHDMVDFLENREVIAPTGISDLVDMVHKLNLPCLAERIQKSFQGTKGQGLPLEEKKNTLIKYAKIAYQKHYGTAKPFPSMSKCSVNSFFVEGGIHYLAQEGDSMQKPDVLESLESYNDILNSPKTESKRKIIEGEPGYGKSTITLQYLYDWCTKNPTSPLKDVDILIYLQLRQLAGVKSIYTAIKKFIVPKDEDMNEACIEEILKVYKKSVVILFDSYDEYPDKNDTETDISSIIEMKMFQEMVVMILTRKLNLPPGLHPDTKRIRLTGFGAAERRNYILKVMDNDVQLADLIEKHLQGNPLLKNLCQVPIVFTMVAHIVHKSPEIKIFSSLTTFFKYLIARFHNHMKSKKGNDTKAPAFERELAKLYRIAFDGLTQKKQQLAWKKTYLVKELGQKFYDYYIDLGILAQDEVFCIVQYRYEIEARLFHKIICEFYASHHLVRILREGTSSAASSINVKETLNSINPLDLQYVYRFACGLNKSAADIIIKHLSETKKGRLCAILCMLEQEEKSEQCLKSVKDLVSSQIVIASHHANLLQRSTIQVLEVASANQISISYVGLFECSPRVDESGLNLIFQSGLSLSILSSLQHLVIHDTDRRLTNEELAAILSYSSQCTSLKLLMFHSYDLQNTIPVEFIPSSLKSRKVKVCNYLPFSSWSLDLQTGLWQASDLLGRLPREELQDLRNLLPSFLSDSPVPSQSADVRYPTKRRFDDSKAAAMTSDDDDGDNDSDDNDDVGDDNDDDEQDEHTVDLTTSHCNQPTENRISPDRTRSSRNSAVSLSRSTDQVFSKSMMINKEGGRLDIPGTGASLEIPSGALEEEQFIKMKIIPPHLQSESLTFASNSSLVVELLPCHVNLLKPAILTLPHCLVLKKGCEWKAKIYRSHHKEGSEPQWEEQLSTNYELGEHSCVIEIQRFSWEKFVVSDKIVEAKKIIVYAAGRCGPTDSMYLDIGYYWDLVTCEKVPKLNNASLLHEKRTIFYNDERALNISLKEFKPKNWTCSTEEGKTQVISFAHVAISEGTFRTFVLDKTEPKGTDACTCHFKAGQAPDLEDYIFLLTAPGPSSVEQPSTSVSDRVVTPATIQGLSEKLCHGWKTVGRKLKIGDPTLEAIDTNTKMVQEKVHRMLSTWKDANGREGTCRLLGEALQAAGQTILKEYVYEQAIHEDETI